MKLFGASLAILPLVLACGASAKAADASADSSVAGEYMAVTESEWAMELILDSDGRATYRITTWEAGKRSSTNSRSSMAGHWKVEGRSVTVSLQGEHAGQSAIYKIQDCLSYESIGRTECSPGLEPVSSTIPVHLFQPLWNVRSFQIRESR